MARPVKDQLATAIVTLGLFEKQLLDYDQHMAMNRRQRRKQIKTGQFDATILDRIDGLREGHAKWKQRAQDLRAELEREDEES